MKKLTHTLLIFLFILLNVTSLYSKGRGITYVTGPGAVSPEDKGVISNEGLYRLKVPGNWEAGPGIGGFSYGIWYDDIDASILVGPSIITEEERSQLKNWSKSKKWIEEYAKTVYGDELKDIRVYGRLEDGISFRIKRKNTELYVRIHYRLTKHYMAEFVGFSEARAHDKTIDKYTKEAAKSFKDVGKPTKAIHYNKNTDFIDSQWTLIGLHDPFYTVKYYFDRAERPEPNAARKATDYVINWKNKDFGKLMGKILNKIPDEIKSSDLDHIKTFDIRRIHGTEKHYTLFINDLTYYIPVDDINIDAFDDISEMKNLEGLNISLKTYKSLKGIWKATSLKILRITPNTNIKSIKGIENLKNLEEISFWGGEFSKELTDITPMVKLDKVTSISCIFPGVKDLSPLTKMKNLNDIFANCHKDLDVKPILDAQHISKVMLNKKQYR